MFALAGDLSTFPSRHLNRPPDPRLPSRFWTRVGTRPILAHTIMVAQRALALCALTSLLALALGCPFLGSQPAAEPAVEQAIAQRSSRSLLQRRDCSCNRCRLPPLAVAGCLASEGKPSLLIWWTCTGWRAACRPAGPSECRRPLVSSCSRAV